MSLKKAHISKLPSPFVVSLGLKAIAVLVFLKAVFLAIFRLIGKLFSPLQKGVLEYIVLPVYGIVYGFRRRMSKWYRPAKNRLMFFLSNRYSIHGVVIVIALVAAGVNLQFDTVRAESGTFGERSLLYGIVTSETVEVIEEYADIENPDTFAHVSYLDEGTLQPLPTEPVPNLVPTSSLLADNIISTPSLSTTTKDTIAPREGVIEYVVRDGDTLSTIAEKFGISLNTLLWANSLNVRSVIKPGNTLSILPVTGVQHKIAKGETLIAIAKKYDVNADEILAYNNLASTDALKIGESLILPGGELKAPAPVARTVAVKQIFTTAPTGSSGATKPAPGAKMVWPTDLKTVVRGLSWYHTGADIDCNGHANGTSTHDNYAAADGIVQFSGTKKGYGNTVEINHGNGIVTRYGHHYSLYVKTGDSVSAGTPLGRCGSTGKSTGTHLHFEVIANGKFMNPFDYLR